MPTAVALSLLDARRMALRAQGFGAKQPSRPNVAHVSAVVGRLGAVQIDAVNVLVRSHYLPVLSRIGPYDMRLFDRLAFERADAFEYLGHAVSFVATELHPALRWRMAEEAANKYWVRGQQAIEARNPGYVDRVLAEVTDRGALTFNELTDPARRERPQTKYAESTLLWWSKRPSDGKHVLDGLWREGRLAVAARRGGFERAFDLTERVLPADVLRLPTPPVDVAQRTLVLHAVRALGVAWIKDVSDYFRLPVAVTKLRLRELVDAGALQTATVEGVDAVAFVDTTIAAGKGKGKGASATPVRARALLSPFDSLLWERDRNVRLFGFRHSFEIYVTEAKRRYGYYVLPFLLDESIVGRVDLKADRANGTLVVQAAHAEPGGPPKAAVASELAAELRRMAGWLGLDRVTVADRGDLAGGLRRAVRSGAA